MIDGVPRTGDPTAGTHHVVTAAAPRAHGAAAGDSPRAWTPWKPKPETVARLVMRMLHEGVYTYGYGSIPIHTIFRGMNIHLPAILMFTRGIGF